MSYRYRFSKQTTIRNIIKAVLFLILHINSILIIPLLIVPSISDTIFIVPAFITSVLASLISYVLFAGTASDVFEGFFFRGKDNIRFQRAFFFVFALLGVLWFVIPSMYAFTAPWYALFIPLGVVYITTFVISCLMKKKN
jgi:hypothetical protein